MKLWIEKAGKKRRDDVTHNEWMSQVILYDWFEPESYGYDQNGFLTTVVGFAGMQGESRGHFVKLLGTSIIDLQKYFKG